MSNSSVVRLLFDHSALLELSSGNQFRVHAFANAARMSEELALDVGHMVEAETLTTIDGVGTGVAGLVGEPAAPANTPPIIQASTSLGSRLPPT